MTKENAQSEISILKESIDHILGDEKVIADFELKFLERAPSMFENWDRSSLEQMAALQFMRANYRRATLMLLIKHTKLDVELSRDEFKTLNANLAEMHSIATGLVKYADNHEELATLLKDELKANIATKKANAKKAINTRHDKPGGSRDMTQKMREIWATGKYTSRDICAEEECAGLKISFAKARKALRNTPSNT